MEMKQVLKKLLSRTVKDNTETIVNERIEKELLTKEELQTLNDQFGDDYEAAYDTYGLMYDFNEELSMIDLDNLCCGLDSLLENDTDGDYDCLKPIREKAEPYRAYNLDFEMETKG